MTTRERIVAAGLAIVEESRTVEGVTVSLETVARRAGLTKPGLMYHFPTKEALVLGLIEQVATRWVELLTEQSGSGPENLSVFDRHRTYVTVAMTVPLTRSDFWAFSDAAYHAALAEAWQRRLAPWLDTAGVPADACALLTLARFAADGAWTAESTGLFRAPADVTEIVHRRALRLVDEAEDLA